jgi:phosphoglycerate dehydrogenase-like enzyme
MPERGCASSDAPASGSTTSTSTACTARGILVINAPTAEHHVGHRAHHGRCCWRCCRNIPEAMPSVKRGEWTRLKVHGHGARRQTLGVIGLGRIGTRVTDPLHAASACASSPYDPYISDSVYEKVGAAKVTLDQLLEQADVITVPHADDRTRRARSIGAGRAGENEGTASSSSNIAARRHL